MNQTTDQVNDYRLMMALSALECSETDLEPDDESDAMRLLLGLDQYTVCLLASGATHGWVMAQVRERQSNGLSREEALAVLVKEFRARALQLANQLAEMGATE